MPTIWVDAYEAIDVDGATVKVTLRSEERKLTQRMSRHTLRRFCALATAALDEADLADADKVRPLRGAER